MESFPVMFFFGPLGLGRFFCGEPQLTVRFILTLVRSWRKRSTGAEAKFILRTLRGAKAR
jgi:hypothetical protein